MLKHVLPWLRQSTTVQGIAALSITAVLQFCSDVPWPIVLAGAVGSLVLLILPGQGDLSGKMGQLAVDAVEVALSRGSKASLGKLALDSAAVIGQAKASVPVHVTGDSIPHDAAVMAAGRSGGAATTAAFDAAATRVLG